MTRLPDYANMGEIQLRTEKQRWDKHRYTASHEGDRSQVTVAKRHLAAINGALIVLEDAKEERAAGGQFGAGS